MDNTIKTADGMEIYENGIAEYLDQYIRERDIDMHSEPQSRWNAALLYINKYLFRDNKDKLKADNIYNTGNLVNGNTSNCNAYDVNKINSICDIYIDLCYEYDKEISIMGFSKLTGITQDTIYGWARDEARLGSSSSEIYKKLSAEREESLSNRLYSNRGNPVGVLGILNRHYGWNMGQPRGSQEQKTQSIAEIEKRYGLSELPENGQQLELPKADF